MKGVNIGRVHDFEIRGDGVAIVLEVEGEWDIPDDSRTQLASTGLLGGVTVEVLRGTSPTMVREGAVIPGRSGSDLFETADQLGTQAQDVLGQIEGLLSASTVEAVEQSATELNALLRSLSELSRTQSSEIAQLTESLNRSAQGVEDASPALQRAIAQADSTMGRLNVTSATLDRAAGSLEVILERVAQGEGSLGRLSTDDTLYDNLAAAAESIRELTTDLRENPGRYIKISVF
jgi:phospholipid/cholesterol/gamma-HCH transport system substrate-binding protein